MRCARCDQIIVRQVLGRLPDGRLVFGWCEACLEATASERVDPPTSGCLSPRALGIKVRERRLDRAQSLWRGLALAWLGGAGLLGAWGVILAYVGGWKLASPLPGAGHPSDLFGSGSAVALIGSAILAALSLVGWMLVFRGDGKRRFLLRSLEVGAVLTAFATLAWGIVRQESRRDPWIVAVVALCAAVALVSRRLERRDDHGSAQTAYVRGTIRQHGRIP
jgi:hypothetical protein